MWTLLRSTLCWEKYQQETSKNMGVVGVPISWGSGPTSFPALVCTYMPPQQPGQPAKLVSAYVYKSDAEALLAAMPAPPKAAPVATVTEIAPVAKPVDTSQQDNCNRYTAAHLLAIIKDLKSVNITTEERYEQSLMYFLRLVDEVTTERRDAVMATLDKTERNIIDRLLP